MIYEIMYIIPSRYSDTEIEGVVKAVEGVLKKNEATIEQSTVLEKLQLAYPIKKDRYGTYVLTFISVEGERLAKIDLDLKLMDELLRHVIVKREEGIPKEAFILKEYQAPITAEGKRVNSVVKPKAVQAPKRKPVTSEDDKMSMEELDKKIDDILDSDLNDV